MNHLLTIERLKEDIKIKNTIEEDFSEKEKQDTFERKISENLLSLLLERIEGIIE